MAAISHLFLTYYYNLLETTDIRRINPIWYSRGPFALSESATDTYIHSISLPPPKKKKRDVTKRQFPTKLITQNRCREG